MPKRLTEMSNEELWQLFPIILCEHLDRWTEDYIAEEESLKDVLQDCILRISHIGSTAIPRIMAKPIVDILLEIGDDIALEELICKMESNGYIYSPQPAKPAPHMMFMKGYTEDGFADKVFHVHVRYKGDWDEIYFRDYLLSHPEAAKEYELLKIGLKDKYEHDRDTYTEAKTEFIQNIIRIAKE